MDGPIVCLAVCPQNVTFDCFELQWDFKITFIDIHNRKKCLIQVNLCQKLLFLNRLTHNMRRDCSLNSSKNTSAEHVLCKNWFCLFLFDIQNNICTQHVLNLYFSGNSINFLLSDFAAKLMLDWGLLKKIYL